MHVNACRNIPYGYLDQSIFINFLKVFFRKKYTGNSECSFKEQVHKKYNSFFKTYSAKVEKFGIMLVSQNLVNTRNVKRRLNIFVTYFKSDD